MIGVNTNLRAIDILEIRAGRVKNLKPGTELALKERKTGKERLITLNRPCHGAVEQLLDSRPHADTDFLFTGQRGPRDDTTGGSASESICRPRWRSLITPPGKRPSHACVSSPKRSARCMKTSCNIYKREDPQRELSVLPEEPPKAQEKK